MPVSAQLDAALAIGTYASLFDWLLRLIGLACIQLIMLGSARWLEIKQGERYGTDPAYRDYLRQVPILFPLVPLHSCGTSRSIWAEGC